MNRQRPLQPLRGRNVASLRSTTLQVQCWQSAADSSPEGLEALRSVSGVHAPQLLLDVELRRILFAVELSCFVLVPLADLASSQHVRGCRHAVGRLNTANTCSGRSMNIEFPRDVWSETGPCVCV